MGLWGAPVGNSYSYPHTALSSAVVTALVWFSSYRGFTSVDIGLYGFSRVFGGFLGFLCMLRLWVGVYAHTYTLFYIPSHAVLIAVIG